MLVGYRGSRRQITTKTLNLRLVKTQTTGRDIVDVMGWYQKAPAFVVGVVKNLIPGQGLPGSDGDK